jgi:hypothetical protein
MRHNDVAGTAQGLHYMKKALLAVTALCLSAAAAAPALATLRGDVASVEADRAHMNGVIRTTPGTGYSVHEISTPEGTVVREYLSADGKVFGFSWRGVQRPDLPQLLGASHYTEFMKAATSVRQPDRRHASVQLPELVVYSAVRLGHFYGRAWAPDLVPAGVSTDEIK